MSAHRVAVLALTMAGMWWALIALIVYPLWTVGKARKEWADGCTIAAVACLVLAGLIWLCGPA